MFRNNETAQRDLENRILVLENTLELLKMAKKHK